MRILRAVVVLAIGCGHPTSGRGDAPMDGFDRTALLANVATNVLYPMQADAAAAASALPTAIAAYCDALDAGQPGPIASARQTAQTAWGDAIDAWQRAEAALVGPAAMDHRALREWIYAWPLRVPCGLDKATVQTWSAPGTYDVAAEVPNARSLYSIEYLLYTTQTAHTCAIEPAGWAQLGADLPRARCRHAKLLADDVAAQAAKVRDAWRPDGGDYVGELVRAGQGSSIPSAQEAVNRITDGLFYVDKYVKDMKLGEAAGISENACGVVGMTCVLEIELSMSDRGVRAIRVNLAALREVFTGKTSRSDGPGFDDFLIAVGNADLATKMVASLDASIARASELPDSYADALASQRDKVVTLHTTIGGFTTELKSQFLTVLALEIPDEVAADND